MFVLELESQDSAKFGPESIRSKLADRKLIIEQNRPLCRYSSPRGDTQTIEPTVDSHEFSGITGDICAAIREVVAISLKRRNHFLRTVPASDLGRCDINFQTVVPRGGSGTR